MHTTIMNDFKRFSRTHRLIYSQFALLSFRPSNQLTPMSPCPTNYLAPLVDQLAPGKYGGELVSNYSQFALLTISTQLAINSAPGKYFFHKIANRITP